MIAFFQNCYHLKDWLKNDSASGVTKGEVERFVKSSSNLLLCGDLCNGSKHLTLRTPRDPNTKIGATHAKVSLMDRAVRAAGRGMNPPKSRIAVTYDVEAGGKTYDAFTLAKDCRDDWEKFLKSKGLL